MGEIRDEFDEDESLKFKKVNQGHFIINAKLLIDDANLCLERIYQMKILIRLGVGFYTKLRCSDWN